MQFRNALHQALTRVVRKYFPSVEALLLTSSVAAQRIAKLNRVAEIVLESDDFTSSELGRSWDPWIKWEVGEIEIFYKFSGVDFIFPATSLKIHWKEIGDSGETHEIWIEYQTRLSGPKSPPIWFSIDGRCVGHFDGSTLVHGEPWTALSIPLLKCIWRAAHERLRQVAPDWRQFRNEQQYLIAS